MTETKVFLRTTDKKMNNKGDHNMTNLICIFTRKPLNPETLEEINENLPLKKKKTKVPAKDAEKKKEHNDR